jgi:predicted phage tail protein
MSIPTAPSALMLTNVTATSIKLNWTDSSTNETGFEIERSLFSAFGFSNITTTAAGATTYTDTGLIESTTYYYRVRAVNGAGNSTYTSIENATTLVSVPTAPSALMLTNVTATSIKLNWTDSSTNETGFEIERSLSSAFGFSNITTTAAGATTYTDTGLTESTTYYYRVRAVNSAGNSAYTSIENATTLATVPTAPSALMLTNVTATSIKLNWTDNSTNETGFEIERSLSSGSGFSNITTTAPDVTTYTDIGLTESTTYYYRVRAVNSAGNSAYTPEKNATTLATVPPAPSSLVATASSDTQIDLSWADNSSNETGFEIERSLSSAFGFSNITTTAAGATTYTDTGLTESTTYYYRVRAVNSAGNSAYTSVMNATTLNTTTTTTTTIPPQTTNQITETTTDSPTTDSPTTNSPTTNSPTTNSPTTNSPTTDGPTTILPTTICNPCDLTDEEIRRRLIYWNLILEGFC